MAGLVQKVATVKLVCAVKKLPARNHGTRRIARLKNQRTRRTMSARPRRRMIMGHMMVVAEMIEATIANIVVTVAMTLEAAATAVTMIATIMTMTGRIPSQRRLKLQRPKPKLQ